MTHVELRMEFKWKTEINDLFSLLARKTEQNGNMFNRLIGDYLSLEML